MNAVSVDREASTIRDLSLFFRPALIVVVASAVIASFHAPFPVKWGLRGTDLGIEQALALLTYFWSLINASLLAWTRGGRPERTPATLAVAVDLAFCTGIVVLFGSKALYFSAMLLVIVSAARAHGRGIVTFATLATLAIILLLPTIQSALGKADAAGPLSEQVVKVVLVLATAFLVFPFAALETNLTAPKSLPSRLLCSLASAFPCVQLALLDPWVGLASAIPAAIALRLALAPSRTLLGGILGHTVAWICGIGSYVAGLATIATGVLLVDSFLPRLLEKLTMQLPILGNPWISSAAIFLTIYLVIELSRRAVVPLTTKPETSRR